MTTPAVLPEDLAGRLAAQIGHQLVSLRGELSEWTATTGEGQPLEKHHSQVRSVLDVLGGYADAAEAAVAAGPSAGRSSPADVILDMHHVWDFFRSKLLLRSVPWHAGFLAAADELAWACYRPALDAAGRGSAAQGPSAEPPLVFLTTSAVPFAAERGANFRDLLPRGGLYTREGATAAARLPFPLIGLPWSHSGHLPGLLAIPHEVGHHIEDDLALTDTLHSCLRRAGVADAWTGWLGEVFADVCGCLSVGEAYAGMLLDALAATDSPSATDAGPAAATAGAEDYPPPRLRAAVCLATLARIDFAPAADGMREAWLDRWPAGTTPDDEADRLVENLLTFDFPQLGGCLPQALQCAQLPQVRATAALLLAGLPTDRGDIRAVAAAAGLAFLWDPRRYQEIHAGEQALIDMLNLRPKGPRATMDDDEMARRRRAAGRAIFDMISGNTA
jgi:hypothetical protein